MDTARSKKEWPPDTFDYVVVCSRSSANMNVSYLMVDHDTNSLAPKVMTLKWPRFIDLVEFRACVVKNVLYIIGGRDKTTGKCLKQVLRYDPTEGRWRECANMRKPRAGHTAVGFNGRIFVAGGCTSKNDMTELCESYEPETDDWHKEEPMFAPRASHACVVREGIMYVTGGKSKTEDATDTIWAFNYSTNWRSLTNNEGERQYLPLCSLNHTSLIYRKLMFVIGGVAYDKEDGVHPDDPYSPQKTPKPVVSDAVNAYKFPKKLTALEQENLKLVKEKSKVSKKGHHATSCPQSQEFKSRKRWIKTLADLPFPRCGAGTVTVGHKIYLIGGSKVPDTTTLNTVNTTTTATHKNTTNNKNTTITKTTTTTTKPTTPSIITTTTDAGKPTTSAVKTTTGEVKTTTGAVKTTTGEVKTTTGAVKTTTGEVKTTTGAVKTTTGEVKTTTGAVKTTTGEVKTTTGAVTTTSQLADITEEGEHESPGVEADLSCRLVQYYHMKQDEWVTSFDLGPGDYREVDCVSLTVPRTNKDFRPMKFSDCKWVLW